MAIEYKTVALKNAPHKRLAIYCVKNGQRIIDVLEIAVNEFLSRRNA